MQVEIEVLGKPNKWSIDQSTIRIGRGPKCDISLPVKQFPNVSPLHAELEAVDGSLRIAPRDASQGELFLNDEPARSGDVMFPGDILRLGTNGPELSVRYEKAPSTPSGYMPTRVINVNEIPGREVTRLMNEPGRTMEVPVKSSAPPAIPAARVPSIDVGPRAVRAGAPEAAQPVAQPVRAAGVGPYSEQGNRWSASPRTAPPQSLSTKPAAPAAPGSSLPDPVVTATLRNLQVIQGVSLAVVILLGIFVLQLRSEVTASHNEIRALRSQNQNALAQVTPSLDARLNAFSQRMDGMDAMFKSSQLRMEQGMDAKMKVAQDQLFANLDTRMKVTEDRMVNRMNTDLPPLLDKYINAKLLEMKH